MLLLQSGKIIVCFLEAPREERFGDGTYTNYNWLEFGYTISNSLHKGRGLVVNPNKESKYYKCFEDIFNFSFEWDADLTEDISHYKVKEVDILAKNGANLPVAFIVELNKEYGGGKVLFLPFLNEEDEEKIKGLFRVAS